MKTSIKFNQSGAGIVMLAAGGEMLYDRRKNSVSHTVGKQKPLNLSRFQKC